MCIHNIIYMYTSRTILLYIVLRRVYNTIKTSIAVYTHTRTRVIIIHSHVLGRTHANILMCVCVWHIERLTAEHALLCGDYYNNTFIILRRRCHEHHVLCTHANAWYSRTIAILI